MTYDEALNTVKNWPLETKMLFLIRLAASSPDSYEAVHRALDQRLAELNNS